VGPSPQLCSGGARSTDWLELRYPLLRVGFLRRDSLGVVCDFALLTINTRRFTCSYLEFLARALYMSPAATTELLVMATESRKRPSPADSELPQTKRQCTVQHPDLPSDQADSQPSTNRPVTVGQDEIAKKGLERGIALVLQRVGFESATPEAMESFVSMTETCAFAL
jgi:hypothetical protein